MIAYRTFAHENQNAYPLPCADLPIISAMERLAGEAHALDGAPTVGDLEAAYGYGIEVILAGISESASRA